MSDASIEVGATVAGHDPAALLSEHGSPLYVYDGDVLRQRIARLRVALPDSVMLAFATKANPSSAVLRLIAQTGLGADVASGGELASVVRAGFETERLVFTGPGKTDAELEAALRVGVGALTIESLDELEALLGMAGLARRGQGLLLRLTATGVSEDTSIIGAAAGSKFGLSDTEADTALDVLARATSSDGEAVFRVMGFHAFGASNVLDAAVLVEAVVGLAARAERIAARHDLAVGLLDAGGGFGIPYADEQTPLDLTALGDGVRAELETWAGRAPLRDTRLLFEPGRWVTGPAGAYLCRVVRTKRRDGRAIAVSDGGIHHLLRPRLVDQDHRVRPVGATSQRATGDSVDVVGPLCTGLDYLASAVSAPEPRAGDTYAILDAGAYGYSESMPFFLSHPIPAEVLVDGDSVTRSRERIEVPQP